MDLEQSVHTISELIGTLFYMPLLFLLWDKKLIVHSLRSYGIVLTYMLCGFPIFGIKLYQLETACWVLFFSIYFPSQKSHCVECKPRSALIEKHTRFC